MAPVVVGVGHRLRDVATQDPDRAVSRYLSGLSRVGAGLEKQRQRILDQKANAPRIRAGSHEIVDFTGNEGLDLDYYIFEMVRLRDMGKAIRGSFKDEHAAIGALLDRFDKRVPRLGEIRNALVHIVDRDHLDDVMWFESVVRRLQDGRVEYLVDPRYGHHDAALELLQALRAFLHGRLRVSIAENPSRPLGEQIAARNMDR
jgi:hypothetical protein